MVAYILRTCGKNGESRGGFVYPTEIGQVAECPDWDPDPARDCGGGLHGLLNGVGDATLIPVGANRLWQVYEVQDDDHLHTLNGKCRWRRGTLVFSEVQQDYYDSSAREHAIAFLAASGCVRAGIVWDCVTAGYKGTATAGDGGTATAGYKGTATAGYKGTATAGDGGTATAGCRGTATAGCRGTATAGYRGTATAGYKGTATAGDGGTATAGCRGTATAGDGGTATAGYKGTATAGYKGTATAGDGGTATAGYKGTATAGYKGTATAGDGGTIVVEFYDNAASAYRRRVAEVGNGDGMLKPNVKYRLDEAGAWMEVQ